MTIKYTPINEAKKLNTARDIGDEIERLEADVETKRDLDKYLEIIEKHLSKAGVNSEDDTIVDSVSNMKLRDAKDLFDDIMQNVHFNESKEIKTDKERMDERYRVLRVEDVTDLINSEMSNLVRGNTRSLRSKLDMMMDNIGDQDDAERLVQNAITAYKNIQRGLDDPIDILELVSRDLRSFR